MSDVKWLSVFFSQSNLKINLFQNYFPLLWTHHNFVIYFFWNPFASCCKIKSKVTTFLVFWLLPKMFRPGRDLQRWATPIFIHTAHLPNRTTHHLLTAFKPDPSNISTTFKLTVKDTKTGPTIPGPETKTSTFCQALVFGQLGWQIGNTRCVDGAKCLRWEVATGAFPSRTMATSPLDPTRQHERRRSPNLWCLPDTRPSGRRGRVRTTSLRHPKVGTTTCSRNSSVPTSPSRSTSTSWRATTTLSTPTSATSSAASKTGSTVNRPWTTTATRWPRSSPWTILRS